MQGRQHKLKEQFDDGAWKPDVGNFEQASGDDGQEEGGDEELEGGKQAKKKRVKKVELQFDCAAVDPDTTDDWRPLQLPPFWRRLFGTVLADDTARIVQPLMCCWQAEGRGGWGEAASL